MKISGNSDEDINIQLSDFGIAKDTQVPNWIPKDNWSDLLALSLLQGEMDHFVVAIISDDNKWRKWYMNPLKEDVPKVEMESDNMSNYLEVKLHKQFFYQIILFF